ACLQDDRSRVARCEKTDQRNGSIGLADRAGECAGKESLRLDLSRNRGHEANSRDMDQLADLLEADLSLAASNDCGDRLAGWRSSHFSALARDLLRDAELGKERRREIRTAATV